MRGRKRKPTELLRAQGAIYEIETQRGFEPIPPDAPATPPPWLQGFALDTWLQLAPMLSAMRVLTRADEIALSMVCESWAMYCANQLEIARIGREVYAIKRYDDNGELEKISVSSMVANSVRLRDAVSKGLEDFGLTPAARARLIVGKMQPDKPKSSLFIRNKNGTS